MATHCKSLIAIFNVRHTEKLVFIIEVIIFSMSMFIVLK